MNSGPRDPLLHCYLRDLLYLSWPAPANWNATSRELESHVGEP
mgnify:CR=1 FL=1